MNAQAVARRRLLEGSAVFKRVLSRIEAVGVTPEWGDDGEPGFTARVLRLFVPRDSITRLQEMAADDAGIVDSAERLHAAELYQRWLLQNYHSEWEEYRKRWPVVEQNPYNTVKNDFGRNPNPIP